MSPVGHSITGLALAALALPGKAPRRWLGGAAFIAIANLPDWPLPGWGHDRYEISHSLFVNLALITTGALVWRSIPALRQALTARLILLAACAWLSHLLLDSFYNHGKGLGIGWPLLEYRLNLPVPFFRIVDTSLALWNPRNLSVFAIELLAYSPLLALALRHRCGCRCLRHQGSAQRDMP
ncbi:MAG TPA: hypothetical protein DIT13_02035 [Verrucomicrobiales bacterium]|nr:hypothetical protein [Verrucomicrobiales bacterium]HRJ08577.1 metal-dependent hydrolase [Prosthecobacter sp.]HRK14490.1 metal-dependent hydrolase [Prosthecobacter sp.]